MPMQAAERGMAMAMGMARAMKDDDDDAYGVRSIGVCKGGMGKVE
jgi:hypothetical protein